ncbi:MAG: Fic family protein [Bacillota bacterium]
MLNFDEYKKAPEPDKREKSEIWEMAIGLQGVDGLKTSEYLVKTAKSNIEGDITFEEVHKVIDQYYREIGSKKERENRTEEADKVSARIAEVLSEKTFSFNPLEYISIHKRLFEGFDFAGRLRDYDIVKDEWVLDGDTVFYASFQNIMATLEYDFSQERGFIYKYLSKEEKAHHIAKFVSGIWQIHPFFEGNTRATAVFAIKYLRKMGYKVNNDLFSEHSWYFRNALVRANYTNYEKDIYSNTVFLERFFENLLIGKENVLRNREMHVSLDVVGDTANKDFDTVNHKNDTVKCKVDTVSQKILDIIAINCSVTADEISNQVNISTATIKRRLKILKENGYIERVGSDKKGSWKIL